MKGTGVPDFVMVLFQLSIRNIGAPSIVENYSFVIQGYGFSRGMLIASQLPPKLDIVLGNPGGVGVTLTQESSIFEKTVQPIQQGAMVRGWLMFRVRDIELELIQQEGVEFTVSFRDVNRKKYTAKYSLRGGTNAQPLSYLPGSNVTYYKESSPARD